MVTCRIIGTLGDPLPFRLMLSSHMVMLTGVSYRPVIWTPLVLHFPEHRGPHSRFCFIPTHVHVSVISVSIRTAQAMPQAQPPNSFFTSPPMTFTSISPPPHFLSLPKPHPGLESPGISPLLKSENSRHFFSNVQLNPLTPGTASP